MAAFDYNRPVETAHRLIVKFGQVGAIRVEAREDDPDSLTPGEPVTTDYPATFVILDYDDRQRDGTRIRQTDRRALIAAKDLAVIPTPAHKLVVGDDAIEIVRVMPLNPAGTPVIYDAQVRT